MTRANPFWRCGSRRDPDEIKRDGWRELGVLAVSVDDVRLDAFERQFVWNIAVRLYGQPNLARNA